MLIVVSPTCVLGDKSKGNNSIVFRFGLLPPSWKCKIVGEKWLCSIDLPWSVKIQCIGYFVFFEEDKSTNRRFFFFVFFYKLLWVSICHKILNVTWWQKSFWCTNILNSQLHTVIYKTQDLDSVLPHFSFLGSFLTFYVNNN